MPGADRALRRLAIAAAVTAAGLAGFAIGAGRHPAPPTLPVVKPAPAYTLTNQLGQTVASREFRGKVQIVAFLFPYCTTMCPLIAAHLANFENLGARPAGIADRVEIVSFNLDPAGTGPPQMRAFLKQYGWNPDDPHWQFLTGSPAAVRRVVRDGFGVAYRRAPLAAEGGSDNLAVAQPQVVNKLAEQAHATYDITHDDIVEIVDRHGRIRKIFENADTVGWTRLLKVVQGLLGDRAGSEPG